MREIKFRCWDTKNKVWVDQVPSLEYLLDDPDAEVSHHDIDSYENSFFYPKRPLGPDFDGRLVYQQSTGLLDSQGKEIWEGDLVDYCRDDAPYEVIFEKGAFSLVRVDDEGCGNFDHCFDKQRDVKVIGNIFENSNLLK